MSDADEALKIWHAIKPMIDKEIEVKARSCVRARKMRVMTAPNGQTIGVGDPFAETAIQIPYTSVVASAQVGDAVWVQWYYNNASTMLAVGYGNGVDSDAQDAFTGLEYAVDANTESLSEIRGTLPMISSIEELDALANRGVHFIRVIGDFTCGSVTIPRFSRGLTINSSGGDSVALFIIYPSSIAACFRNGTTWTAKIYS